ncbi:MAG: DEAD/DEAH box helicase family protein [Prevotella sp.]|nr:DEAD/DEAH box helicase family protein [Prevotella sp.]
MLRDYQKDICSKTEDAFQSHRSVMVRMPTGTGKTVVLASLVNEERRMKNQNAFAIDSKTPTEVRRQTVEDFKAGRIRIMVSVDLFSEGFDCPDMEFIQLARPTLSLAKYLQMVGRGLRKSEGKETCVMIDNVWLYRMFGLPAADRDWQAMFEGRMAGEVSKTRDKNNDAE